MAFSGQKFAYSCEICGIRSSGHVDYEAHIRGIKHVTEVKKLAQGEKRHGPTLENKVIPYRCLACKKTFDSAKVYGKHLATTHPRVPPNVVDAEKYGSIIPCKLCNLEMSGPISYQQHLEGRFHQTLLLQKRGARAENRQHYPKVHDRWRPEYFPPRMYRAPEQYYPFYYHRGLHPRWDPGYFPGVRGSYYHIAEKQFYSREACLQWAPMAVGEQYASCSYTTGRVPQTGLYHCQMCDTHHRSGSHYKEHLASEHQIQML